jgi:hypothetical protein
MEAVAQIAGACAQPLHDARIAKIVDVLAGRFFAAAPASLARTVRRSISSGSPFEPTMGFSRAVRVDTSAFIVVSGLLDPRRRVEIEADAVIRES